jgi:diguanylate cyclase (GGDEF)-like protein
MRAMKMSHLRSLLIRHRRSIKDLSILVAILLVGLFVAFEVDIFANEDKMTVHEETVELDEVLLLGGLLAVGLLVFAIRRYREQKQEAARRIVAEQHVRELAFQDGLTGLPNRRQFDEALATALASPPRAGAFHAVLLMDLNGFKRVNDIHGHAIGDELLMVVAQRLLCAMRNGDLVARFGGDEFAILACHVAGAEAATGVAMRVIEALEAPITTGAATHSVGVGIGIALSPSDGSEAAEVLRKADVALYRAKAERRSALRFFELQMDQQVRERERLEQALRAALLDRSIATVFRPTVDLNSRKVVGFEATPRWTHATFGEVPPERFVPIAADTGLIHELAAQVLREGCEAAANWPHYVSLAVDLYPIQLRDSKFAARVLAILAETGLAPHRLEIELTESALVQDMDAAREILGALRAAGIKIVLDNFGTGYSSLYHLRNFKLDKIKIDRSFIASMASEQQSAAIVGALVGLGSGLGVTVAAEGIDETQQRASLLHSGCVQGQGQLFGDALPAAMTARLFSSDCLPRDDEVRVVL